MTVMPLRYHEERATQAAAYLLKRRGGTMSYMKLLKLLYYADRIALLELGRPITFDQYYSMDHGPVLSRTCDLITSEPDYRTPSYWHRYIAKPANYEVSLIEEDPPRNQLSSAEEAVLDRVFDGYGHLSRWAVRDSTHDLPEWKDPAGSSIPILYRDILTAAGFSVEEAKAAEADLAAEAELQRLTD